MCKCNKCPLKVYEVRYVNKAVLTDAMLQEVSGGTGPIRREKRRHEVNPLDGIRRNPFELLDHKPSDSLHGINPPSKPVISKLLARDYLLAFTRQLQSNIGGTEYLVGDKVSTFQLL